jgi:nucleoside-diphosphate-sugar epimerase
MRIFLAGAGGVIGRRLTPLLVKSGHQVAGTTRSPEKIDAIAKLGAEPIVVDVFDAEALKRAVAAAKPDVVVHQLTDLAYSPTSPHYQESLKRNARIRVEGTPNLVAAARAAGVRRLIAQSIAFIYAEGPGARVETDALAPAEGVQANTIPAVKALEDAVLAMPEGIVLRYGYFWGPGTWAGDAPGRRPCVHLDAAAQACANALTRGEPGIYNIAEDDPALSSEKAKRLLGFDPGFRM